MNKISDITRQDILDVIKNGIVISSGEPINNINCGDYKTEHIVKIPFHGRLDEISFLSRIYNLNELPSKDRRYKNAHEDISCHLYWGDYESDCWFFQDERFGLRQGDGDEPLLRFLCEMIHPAVRIETSAWKEYLYKFNDLLRADGYELYPAQHYSGRDIYKAREYVKRDQPLLPNDLFTERYKGQIEYGSGVLVDNISSSIDFKSKRQICRIMTEFMEPIQYRPNRYNSWVETTDALEQATKRLNNFLESLAIDFQPLDVSIYADDALLATYFTPFIFDLIELQYDELTAREKDEFQCQINDSFQRDNIPFRLNDRGLVEQLTVHEVLTSEVITLGTQIPEPGLRELFDLAIEKHMQPNLQAHKDAVEKMWDVLERLKTFYTDLGKKQSADKIIKEMSKGQEAYIRLFTAEFKALTDIGNQFRIRHHETDKIDITDIRYYDYFFNRCLSLIVLALQYLN